MNRKHTQPQHLNRRQMLRSLAGAVAVSAFTPWSLGQSNAAGRKLGVCSISFLLRWPSVDRGRAPVSEVLEFIDHCHQLGAGGVQTSLPSSPEFSNAIRDRIGQLGMYLEGHVTLPRAQSDVDEFESQVAAAKQAGAKALRTACLSGRRYETFTTREAFQEFARQAERSVGWAEPVVRKHRVRLAVENHKDWRVSDLVPLMERISSEYVGICVDTGNSIALLEDPMAVVEAYAPYAMCTHLKDMALREYEKGFLLAEVPLGEGCLNLPKIVRVLRQARPDVQFSLEMITRDPLQVPCLTKPYWTTFQSVPAWDLASTLAMVRAQPAAALPQVSGLSADDKLALEESAVRKSIAYARQSLDL